MLCRCIWVALHSQALFGLGVGVFELSNVAVKGYGMWLCSWARQVRPSAGRCARWKHTPALAVFLVSMWQQTGGLVVG